MSSEQPGSSYLFTLLEREGIWVDAAIYGNLSWYSNHEIDKKCNITPKIMYVNGEFRIKFTALRHIKAGKELFFNYSEHFPNLTKQLLNKDDKDSASVVQRSKCKATATAPATGKANRNDFVPLRSNALSGEADVDVMDWCVSDLENLDDNLADD
jgi:hypothetical protein